VSSVSAQNLATSSSGASGSPSPFTSWSRVDSVKTRARSWTTNRVSGT
jgi:hypothetical protein